MTTTLFKHVAYGLIGLCLVLIFLGVQMTGSSTPAAAALTPVLPSTAALTPVLPSTQAYPTKARYNCGDSENPDYIDFRWMAPRPNGGWVGEVTYQGVTTKIQAYDAKVKNDLNLTDWGFQAQNGSFVCRMYVSPINLKKFIWFGRCNNNNWPQPSCGPILPGPGPGPSPTP
jgi:hypothetical protein